MTAIDKGRASLSVLFCTKLEIYFILGDGGWMDMFVYAVGEKSLLRGLSSYCESRKSLHLRIYYLRFNYEAVMELCSFEKSQSLHFLRESERRKGNTCGRKTVSFPFSGDP